jgi:hypothetical protein
MLHPTFSNSSDLIGTTCQCAWTLKGVQHSPNVNCASRIREQVAGIGAVSVGLGRELSERAPVRRVRCKEGQLGDLFCKEAAGSGTVDVELERGVHSTSDPRRVDPVFFFNPVGSPPKIKFGIKFCA